MTENSIKIVGKNGQITLIGDAAHPMSPFKGQEQIKQWMRWRWLAVLQENADPYHNGEME
jgi:hypothetical protein